MNSFLTNFRRTLNARTFLCAAAVTLLCFFSHDITANSYENPPTLFELTAKAFAGSSAHEYNREYILQFFDSSFWFYTVLPVIVSMPAVSDFYEEWFGGGFFLNVHRQQIFKFSVSKSLAYALNAAAVFAAGFAVFAAPVCLAFPSLDAELLTEVYPGGFAAFLAERVLNVAAVSAVCPIITILILIVIKEKFLALSFPMLANYLTAQLGGFLTMRAYDENKPYLEKISLLLPNSQFTQCLSFETVFGAPFFVWYIAWGLFFALCAAGLILLVKRRVKNGG